MAVRAGADVCGSALESQKSQSDRLRMAGLMIFTSLAEALKYGFQVCDRTRDGYLVRTQTAAGWALGVVICKN
jgi:hypothetical protein